MFGTPFDPLWRPLWLPVHPISSSGPMPVLVGWVCGAWRTLGQSSQPLLIASHLHPSLIGRVTYIYLLILLVLIVSHSACVII